MFDLQLDLKMYFCPPMDEIGGAICLTRLLQLPFPPFNDLAIAGSAVDVCPMAEGLRLKAVVWDIDRSRFTAETTIVHQDLPLAYIADELASWAAIGWRLGSYADDYPDEFGNTTEDEVADEESAESGEPDDDDILPKKSPRQRPKEFNKLFRALIRSMCEAHNGTSRAYAMWKTQRFFSEDELKSDESGPAKKFKDAEADFHRMSFDEQYDWEQRIRRSYPRLDRVIS